MHTTVLTLKVFLASPGDVKPERVAAEEAVTDIKQTAPLPRLAGNTLHVGGRGTGLWKTAGDHQCKR